MKAELEGGAAAAVSEPRATSDHETGLVFRPSLTNFWAPYLRCAHDELATAAGGGGRRRPRSPRPPRTRVNIV